MEEQKWKSQAYSDARRTVTPKSEEILCCVGRASQEHVAGARRHDQLSRREKCSGATNPADLGTKAYKAEQLLMPFWKACTKTRHEVENFQIGISNGLSQVQATSSNDASSSNFRPSFSNSKKKFKAWRQKFQNFE